MFSKSTRLAGLGAVAALAVTGLGTGTANAAPLAGGALDCSSALVQTAGDRVIGFNVPDGKMVKDRISDIPSATEMAATEASLAEQLATLDFAPADVDILDPIKINVYYHLIREDGTVGGGNVPRTWVRDQQRVLNHAYRGHGESKPGVRTPFKFILGGPANGLENGVERITNANWFNNADQPSVEADMKSSTRAGNAADLNIWTTNLSNVGLLGYATFPTDYNSAPDLDGVVMDPQTMPGGAAVPYNFGDTATHEVGHWVGLYHTFQNGCAAPGDEVSDTPFEAEPYFGECQPNVDTCTNDPGDDPIKNFMDYSDDVCLDQFTVGQRERALEMWFSFRD